MKRLSRPEVKYEDDLYLDRLDKPLDFHHNLQMLAKTTLVVICARGKRILPSQVPNTVGQQQPEEKHRDSGKDYHFNMSYRQDVRKDEVDDDGDDSGDNYHSNMSHGQDIGKDEGEEVLDFC